MTTNTTTDHSALLNGYFGHVNQVLTLADGRELVEIHIACPVEDWESGEWYINGTCIARCDGHNGVTWETGFEPTEEIEDLVTSYNFDGLLERAKADTYQTADEDDTDVRILITPNYYIGQINAPQPHIITGREVDQDDYNNDDEHTFDTYQDAQDWIDARESTIYVTANGEAGRPEYKIAK